MKNNDYYSQNEYDANNYQISSEQEQYEQMLVNRMKRRRREAEKRRVRRNRVIALVLLVGVTFIIVRICTKSDKSKEKETAVVGDSSSVNLTESSKTATKSTTEENSIIVNESQSEHIIQQSEGLTFVDGILIVNKTYSLPSDYAPGISASAMAAFDKMSAAAEQEGINLFVNSGYRSYQEQEELYNMYASERGIEEADKVSSRPGHSEHQTGLTFDVNSTDFSFENTAEAKWLAEHCWEYGFIIRYPKDKEDITGYTYEPWHIRYLGVDTAKKVTESGLCLEEYLGITSNYDYADDNYCNSLNY